VAGATGAWVWRTRGEPRLPADLKGTLVFVSGRAGLDSLYVKRLPDGEERRLTLESEPVAEPALSSDGALAAFVVGGRIGLATLASGDVRLLTLGVDWKDASPAWLPDGRGLVVSRLTPRRGGLHHSESAIVRSSMGRPRPNTICHSSVLVTASDSVSGPSGVRPPTRSALE